MKEIVSTLILLSLLASSVNAQDQESPKEKLHRDFPNVQVIRPSLPAWHFNFDSHRWERDPGLQLENVPAAHVDIDMDLLSRLPSKHRANRLRRKRTHHHIHRKASRR